MNEAQPVGGVLTVRGDPRVRCNLDGRGDPEGRGDPDGRGDPRRSRSDPGGRGCGLGCRHKGVTPTHRASKAAADLIAFRSSFRQVSWFATGQDRACETSEISPDR